LTKKKFEFSKLIICCLTITYFVGLVVGCIITLENPDQLSTYLTYIGGVVGITVPFYIWKAKAENILKIQKENPEEIANKIINEANGGGEF